MSNVETLVGELIDQIQQLNAIEWGDWSVVGVRLAATVRNHVPTVIQCETIAAEIARLVVELRRATGRALTTFAYVVALPTIRRAAEVWFPFPFVMKPPDSLALVNCDSDGGDDWGDVYKLLIDQYLFEDASSLVREPVECRPAIICITQLEMIAGVSGRVGPTSHDYMARPLPALYEKLAGSEVTGGKLQSIVRLGSNPVNWLAAGVADRVIIEFGSLVGGQAGGSWALPMRVADVLREKGKLVPPSPNSPIKDINKCVASYMYALIRIVICIAGTQPPIMDALQLPVQFQRQFACPAPADVADVCVEEFGARPPESLIVLYTAAFAGASRLPKKELAELVTAVLIGGACKLSLPPVIV